MTFRLISFLCTLLLWLGSSTAGTIHRGNGAEPETLDIHRSSGVPEANIQRDLFEGLVAEAADGSLIPGVAKSWSISDDGKTYTFHLRDDARWSDGSPVTAADFVYGFTRALAPKTASDYAFILWPVKNAEAFSKGELDDPKALGIEAVDAQTLKISLERPTPYFLGLLTHHMAYPAPHQAIEKHRRQWTRPGNMVSNGAYRLVEWQPQSRIRLEKNPHYHAADTVQTDTIIYLPTEDKNTELKRFRAGELDITEDVPSSQIPWIEKNLPDAFHSTPYIGTYYFAFNLGTEPFKGQPNLRRALALAIDRKLLTDKVTKGGEIPALGWVPPGVRDYQPQSMAEASLEQKAREEKARQLYAEAGYDRSNPLTVELLYNTSDNHKKIAIAVAAMWKKVLGVKTRLRNEEWKVYLDSRKKRDFQVIRAGWIGDYNDAHTFLSLFHSDVGQMNPAGYANPAYDELMDAAENSLDPTKRAELMQQAEALLLADLPLIPIYYYTTQHLVSPRIEGWEDNVMDVHPSRFLRKHPVASQAKQ